MIKYLNILRKDVYKRQVLMRGIFLLMISLGIALLAECLVFNFRAVFSSEKEKTFLLSEIEQENFEYSNGTLITNKGAFLTLRFNKAF